MTVIIDSADSAIDIKDLAVHSYMGGETSLKDKIVSQKVPILVAVLLIVPIVCVVSVIMIFKIVQARKYCYSYELLLSYVFRFTHLFMYYICICLKLC